MANVVVVGAQWGDEGKGKIVDWLSRARRRRRALPGRPQRRPHAGHRRHRSTSCRCCPRASCGRASSASSATASWSIPGRCSPRSRSSRAQGVDDHARRTCCIAENAPLILPLHRDLDRSARGSGRRGEDRHHRPRHRPGLRGQGRPPRHPRRRPRRRRRRSTTKHRPAARPPQRAAPRPRRRADRPRRRCCAQLLRGRAEDPALRRAGLARARRRAPRRASASCSRARRARCSTSTTAPIPTSPRPTRVAGRRRPAPGMGPGAVGFVLGIVKAYTTRVGDGPFPTELDRRGRRAPRRARPRVRHRHRPQAPLRLVRRGAGAPDGARLSGIDGIALTKLDVLDGFDELKICVGYTLDGERIDYLPRPAARRRGSSRSTRRWRAGPRPPRGARSWAELPAQAIKYVRRIEELIELPGRAALHQPGARRHHPGERPLRGVSGHRAGSARRRWALVVLLVGLAALRRRRRDRVVGAVRPAGDLASSC